MVRIYAKGRPSAQSFAEQARRWNNSGARVQCLNEPNNPVEQFGDSPADYAGFYRDVAAKCPDVRLYWAAPSPGLRGWEDWYGGAELAYGVAVHAYGEFEEMCAIVASIVARVPSKPIWISECNFGPGPDRIIDRDAWAHEHLRPFLDWCNQQPMIEAVTYFAYRWPNPDLTSATPVDGVGTAIETVLREWKETTLALKDQYPQIYAAWEAAGGVENNFRKHLLGIGAIAPTTDDAKFLASELSADVDQIKTVLGKLPKA